MNSEDILRLKVRLLTEGAQMPEDEWEGRRGGAGPVRGRYFLLPNGRPCGIPIRRGKAAEIYHSAPLVPSKDRNIWIYDGSVQLRLIPHPRFLDGIGPTGIPNSKLALLHGSECIATTVYQQCRYWDDGTQCAFCTIPVSLSTNDTILEKTPEQIRAVVMEAVKEGVAKHVLLTTGTPNDGTMGAERIINIVTAIREVSDIPIGIQVEPPFDLSLIDRIIDAGANAIGLHLESADESVRARVCPGKFKHGSVDLYLKTWQHAVSRLGRGNVSTFLLHGLGEDLDLTLQFIDHIAEFGVMPVVAPIRPAPGSKLANYIPTYVGDLEGSLEFYKQVGRILVRHGLNPSKTIAGCHRCGGCTPIQEAYDWAAQSS